MYSSVSELEKEVFEKIFANDLNGALILIIRFVEEVLKDSRFTGNVFGSSTLDLLCQRIGEKSLEELNLPEETNNRQKNECVVFIATELFMTGAHSAILEDIIKARPGKQYIIFLTNLYDSGISQDSRKRFEAITAKVHCAPNGSALIKLKWLQSKLIEFNPGQIFLFNHHQDAVAIAAVQPALKSQVIFHHHADHHLCLGVFLTFTNHIDPTNLGYYNCRNQLGLEENIYFPMTVNDLGVRPFHIPFLKDGKLRTCSSGSESKFESPYSFSYFVELPNLLNVTNGVHIHIGKLSSNNLEIIYRGMKKRNIDEKRLVYIPWVKSLWLALIEQRIDLYISSYPLGGGRASIEVMGSGTPMVVHKSQLSRFYGGGDLVYPQVFFWEKPRDLFEYLSKLLPDFLKKQGGVARKHYEGYYMPIKVKQKLDKLGSETIDFPPLPLRGYTPDLLQKYLSISKLNEKEMGERVREQFAEKDLEIVQLTQALARIHGSLGWKLIMRCRDVQDYFLPFKTRRRKVYDFFLRNSKIIFNEGFGVFYEKSMHQFYQKYRPKIFYKLWILKNEPDRNQLRAMEGESKKWGSRPKVSIITPVFNPNQYDLTQCIQSVLNQVYDNWELCLADGGSDKLYVKEVIKGFSKKDPRIKFVELSKNQGIVGNSNEALKLATGEFVGFLDHDDMLAPFALFEVVKVLNSDPTVDFFFSDEDKLNPKGKYRYDPYFKPDWSPDTFLSYNYTCHFVVARKNIIDEIGGFRDGFDGSQDYDLILRIIQKTSKIRRIPKILYHWRAAHTSVASDPKAKPYAYIAAKKAIQEYLEWRGYSVDVLDGVSLGAYRVKYQIKTHGRVCIIIPTKDKVQLLKGCVASVLEKTDYSDFEILIIDNQSKEKDTFDFYDSLKGEEKIRVLNYKKPFNFSAINNFAAASTGAEYLVFLNNDTEVINSDWLSSMLEFAQREDVGAVGARLYYPNNTIQHAGLIIGVLGFAGHAHREFPRTSSGYKGRIKIIQNMSAVTAACMMVRKKVFDEVGGFDEELINAFNDVDLCLKIREKGYLIVYTPYAELYHHESISRGPNTTRDGLARFDKEVNIVQTRWKHVLDAGDPYYNPNLTLEKEDFGIRL